MTTQIQGETMTPAELEEATAYARGGEHVDFPGLARWLSRALAHITALSPPTPKDVAQDYEDVLDYIAHAGTHLARLGLPQVGAAMRRLRDWASRVPVLLGDVRAFQDALTRAESERDELRERVTTLERERDEVLAKVSAAGKSMEAKARECADTIVKCEARTKAAERQAAQAVASLKEVGRILGAGQVESAEGAAMRVATRAGLRKGLTSELFSHPPTLAELLETVAPAEAPLPSKWPRGVQRWDDFRAGAVAMATALLPQKDDDPTGVVHTPAGYGNNMPPVPAPSPLEVVVPVLARGGVGLMYPGGRINRSPAPSTRPPDDDERCPCPEAPARHKFSCRFATPAQSNDGEGT